MAPPSFGRDQLPRPDRGRRCRPKSLRHRLDPWPRPAAEPGRHALPASPDRRSDEATKQLIWFDAQTDHDHGRGRKRRSVQLRRIVRCHDAGHDHLLRALFGIGPQDGSQAGRLHAVVLGIVIGSWVTEPHLIDVDEGALPPRINKLAEDHEPDGGLAHPVGSVQPEDGRRGRFHARDGTGLSKPPEDASPTAGHRRVHRPRAEIPVTYFASPRNR